MTSELKDLLELARKREMTPSEQEAQRLSFAYGNANIENEHVTRETVAHAAKKLDLSADD